MTTVPLEASQSEDRQARLQAAVAGLRSRAGRGDLKRYMLIGGALAMALGLVLIIWGWFGAAHTARLFEQTPYLISGGLFGLALVFGGGFFYFAYWLTELIGETRRDNAKLVETLGQIEKLLAAESTASPSGSGRLVATARGTMFHRPDCVVVANRDKLREVRPDAKGLAPCKICDPLGEAA